MTNVCKEEDSGKPFFPHIEDAAARGVRFLGIDGTSMKRIHTYKPPTISLLDHLGSRILVAKNDTVEVNGHEASPFVERYYSETVISQGCLSSNSMVNEPSVIADSWPPKPALATI